MFLNFCDNLADFSKSFGAKILFFDAGYFSIIFKGLIGLATKFPLQLGQTFSKISIAHVAQYVHSKEQIIASVEVLGKSLPQCSQLGLIFSMIKCTENLIKFFRYFRIQQ